MINSSTTIQLHDMLKPNLGSQTSECLINYIDTKVDAKLDEKLAHLATKDDLHKVEIDLRDRLDRHFMWIIGLFVSQTVLFVGLFYFLIKTLAR